MVPVFQGRDVLRRCLLSIEAQRVQPVEVFVINNQPHQELEDVIPRMRATVKLLTEPRQGAALARNLGLSKSSTDHTAFLDCDDEWQPGFLEVMTDAIDRNSNNCVLFAGSATLSDDVTRRQRTVSPALGRHALIRTLLHNDLTTSATVVHTSSALACGGFMEGLGHAAGCEDFALWICLLRMGPGLTVPGARVTRHDSGSERWSESFYRDLERAILHSLGSDPPRILAKAARAGLLMRRGTVALAANDRASARGYFRAALAAYPLSLRGWEWALISHMPKAFEASAREIAALMRSSRAH